jgi:hypothetical protein
MERGALVVVWVGFVDQIKSESWTERRMNRFFSFISKA